MCAGVPTTGMVPQYGPTVMDPSMVAGVMAAESTNPWSAAQRVKALMSSPQTDVKELTYLMGSQDLSSDEEVKKTDTANGGVTAPSAETCRGGSFCAVRRQSNKGWLIRERWSKSPQPSILPDCRTIPRSSSSNPWTRWSTTFSRTRSSSNVGKCTATSKRHV